MNRTARWIPIFLIGVGALATTNTKGAAEGEVQGVHLVLEVKVDSVWKDRIKSLADDVHAAMRRHNIVYRHLRAGANALTFKLADHASFGQAKHALRMMLENFGTESDYRISRSGETEVSIKPTDDYRRISEKQIMAQSVEVARRRIQSLAGPATRVRLSGKQIEVDVPGYTDLEQVQACFEPPQKLTLHLVDENISDDEIVQQKLPPNVQLVPKKGSSSKHPLLLPIFKKGLLTGDHIVDADVSYNVRTGEPVVTVRLDSSGRKALAHITGQNIGRRLAIVVGGKVISAPVIQELILGGSLEISGESTLEDANQLAAKLRASALPPPFRILDLRLAQFPVGG